MRSFLTILLFSIIFVIISSIDLKCKYEDQKAKYARGDTAFICVHFLLEEDPKKALRMVFEVTVDKYTAVQVKGIYSKFIRLQKPLKKVGLVVQADNSLTNSDRVVFMKRGAEVDSEDIVIPIFSIVVEIEDGTIKKTTWDNDCFDCTSLCYLDKINENKTQTNCRIDPCNITADGQASACDPRIYVSWIGTDSDGSHMNSAGIRISRFRQYSIGDMYSSALNTYDSLLLQSQSSFSSEVEQNLNTFYQGGTLGKLIVASSSFSNGDILRSLYTKAGGNISPALSWTTTNNTQSFAIVMNHTNSTVNGTWKYTHWIIKNIPATTLSIPENSLGGGVFIQNSWQTRGYYGPENVDLVQTYNFYVYAVKVASMEATNLTAFYSELEKEKVGYGSLKAIYANTKN